MKIPLASVNLDTMEFTVRMKGGAVKTKDFHPSLLPIFKRLKEAGESHVYPVSPHDAVQGFCKLFKALGMPYSFHCCRVTFISRARRAGVDRWTVMQLVDHSSPTVHQIYSRYGRTDLKAGLSLAVGGQKPAQPPQSSSPQSSASPALPDHTGHCETDLPT